MIKELLWWWRTGRHIRALEKQEMIVYGRARMTIYWRWFDGFVRWVQESGALNDGTVPSRTRKKVVGYARSMWAAAPREIGSGNGP